MFKIFLYFFVFVSFGVNAELYSLFVKLDDGTVDPVFNYDELMSRLVVNDILKFTDGKIIKIGKELGANRQFGTTRVFEIKNPDGNNQLVLRLPKYAEHFKYAYETQKGYVDLLNYGVPTVKVHNPGNVEYIIVDRLGKNTKTFFDLVHNKVSKTIKVEMIIGLKKFARKTALFYDIGDFKRDQFVYDLDSKAWILFDWSNKHKIVHDLVFLGHNPGIDVLLNKKNIFDHQFFDEYTVKFKGFPIPLNPENKWIAQLQLELMKEVAKERARLYKQQKKLSFLGSCFQLLKIFIHDRPLLH